MDEDIYQAVARARNEDDLCLIDVWSERGGNFLEFLTTVQHIHVEYRRKLALADTHLHQLGDCYLRLLALLEEHQGPVPPASTN
jgi:hypothetical protein